MRQLSLPEILTLDAFQAAFVTCQERNVVLPQPIESVISRLEQYTDDELNQLASTHELFEAFYKAERIAPTRGEEERNRWLRSRDWITEDSESTLGEASKPQSGSDSDWTAVEQRFRQKFSEPSEELDTASLFREYQHQKSISIRNQLVGRHKQLVHSIADRISHQCTEPYNDLEQVGYLGLIRAIERFNLDQGYTFPSFAAPYIRGEILHFLRDRATSVRIPRRWQDIMQASRQVSEKLAHDLGRQPHDEELAEKLSISIEEWQNIKHTFSRNQSFLHTPKSSPHKPISETTREPLLELNEREFQKEKVHDIATKSKSTAFWDNLDHIGIMGAGGGFLGGMLVQLFGGGATQLIGAAIGMLAGGAYGWWSTVKQQQSNKNG